ncbi:MAG: MbcA/ParS/Xre antitoxin family protein [Burkholderiaceae bacterium]|nr:MbcA/ParS/Xre antitoxin family protein [Burkholderiaceae bacterium]
MPDDLLNFGHGSAFDAKKTAQFLSLKKADVGRIASVAATSVRWDDNIPDAVRVRLEEIASTINLVAKQFSGDPEKTAAWFRARNPLLGDISPRDMIRLGKYDRLRRFIIQAMTNQTQVK